MSLLKVRRSRAVLWTFLFLSGLVSLGLLLSVLSFEESSPSKSQPSNGLALGSNNPLAQPWEKTANPLLYSALWLSRLAPPPPPSCPRPLLSSANTGTVDAAGSTNDTTTEERIPKIVHFIYGLLPQSDAVHGDFKNEFTLLHALSIQAAHTSIRPERILFHYKHLPKGKYWEKILPLLTLRPLASVPTEMFGTPIKDIAHQSDILRLQILYEEGGIYLDIDMFLFKSLDPWLSQPVLMAKEEDYGLCNAFIAARPKSRFIQRWLDNYATFQMVGDKWNFHSVHLPLKLALQFPEEICTLSKQFLFYPSYHINHLFLVHETGTAFSCCFFYSCILIHTHFTQKKQMNTSLTMGTKSDTISTSTPPNTFSCHTPRE